MRYNKVLAGAQGPQSLQVHFAGRQPGTRIYVSWHAMQLCTYKLVLQDTAHS